MLFPCTHTRFFSPHSLSSNGSSFCSECMWIYVWFLGKCGAMKKNDNRSFPFLVFGFIMLRLITGNLEGKELAHMLRQFWAFYFLFRHFRWKTNMGWGKKRKKENRWTFMHTSIPSEGCSSFLISHWKVETHKLEHDGVIIVNCNDGDQLLK